MKSFLMIACVALFYANGSGLPLVDDVLLANHDHNDHPHVHVFETSEVLTLETCPFVPFGSNCDWWGFLHTCPIGSSCFMGGCCKPVPVCVIGYPWKDLATGLNLYCGPPVTFGSLQVVCPYGSRCNLANYACCDE
jgi:hypothetical protein